MMSCRIPGIFMRIKKLQNFQQCFFSVFNFSSQGTTLAWKKSKFEENIKEFAVILHMQCVSLLF